MPALDGLDLAALREALAALGADGWLLFDFRSVNPVAGRVLAVGGMGTRRLFVLLPQRGAPVAVAHRIELQPLQGFPGEVRPYGSWRGLDAPLRARGPGERRPGGISPPHTPAHPPIVAFQENAALPHYEPHEGADRRLEAGQVLLLDLWAGPALGTVFADQTWMAFAGRAPDADVKRVWQAVREARDVAVETLRKRWDGGGGNPKGLPSGRGEGPGVTGADLDDAARAVSRDAGSAGVFVHRTGHSIDRDLHGSGPHLDNFETADSRPLVAGIGFSVEPGVYLPGRFGMRSEINVFLAESGPEVTPPSPQRELFLV